MLSLADAIRRAATVVDTPGAPLSLRLDRVDVTVDAAHLQWSFLDPREPHVAIRGQTRSVITRGRDRTAQMAWAEAQLAAAHRHRDEVDSDLLPGVPYVAHHWSTDEAWAALLGHLAIRGVVEVQDAQIEFTHNEDTDEVITYRIDPVEWAAYLNASEIAIEPEEPDVTDTVPAATPMDHGLPLWASDDLAEASGAWGPIIGLIDGELVGLDVSGRRRDPIDAEDVSTDSVIGPADPRRRQRLRGTAPGEGIDVLVSNANGPIREETSDPGS